MVHVHDVHKQFATVQAVAGVSLDVQRGEIFALLGPNGAGKTTMIRMLLGLIRPDSGTIVFDGLRALADGGVDPREVGYLPEDRGLYPDVNVLRTLTYFGTLRGMTRRAARDEAQAWLDRMSLRDRESEPLKALSKGNQQKVQFISAVLHRPAFAILDEPFSGLDPLNQELFLTLIRELRDAGTTVLLAAHQMQLVERIAAHVVVMNRGSVVLSGSLPEVRRLWTTGNRLIVRVATPPSEDTLRELGTRATVHVREPDELELLVPDEAPLGPVLTDIGARLDVRNIESHPITLHDVYVGAIARHNAQLGGEVSS